MKRLRYLFETRLTFSSPVERHTFTLRCLPAQLPRQRILSETVTVEPQAHYAIQLDGFGNRLICGESLPPHSSFVYRAEGLAAVDITGSDAPHPIYKIHSSQCLPTGEVLALYRSVPPQESPMGRALALMAAAHEALRYQPDSTTLATTAGQALAQGVGVCQDYAQLLLTLLRLDGLPARYCSGLLPGTGTTHAWVEVWVEGRWLGLDPTRGCPAGESCLILSAGRDSRDCVVEQGVFWGNAAQHQQILTQLNEV